MCEKQNSRGVSKQLPITYLCAVKLKLRRRSVTRILVLRNEAATHSSDEGAAAEDAAASRNAGGAGSTSARQALWDRQAAKPT